MSMSYLDIQDAVLADAFDESKRAMAKTWIQFRHAWLWDIEDWTFRYGTSTVTFTANSQTVGSLPSDFHAVVAFYDANGCPIRGVEDFRSFFDIANANTTPTVGTPSRYTVIGGSVLTDTLGDGTSGVLVYEKSKPELVNDDATTGLPEGYDLALVFGAKSAGFKLGIVPDLAASFDQDFTAAVNVLKANYLTQVKETGQSWGAYTAGYWR